MLDHALRQVHKWVDISLRVLWQSINTDAYDGPPSPSWWDVFILLLPRYPNDYSSCSHQPTKGREEGSIYFWLTIQKGRWSMEARMAQVRALSSHTRKQREMNKASQFTSFSVVCDSSCGMVHLQWWWVSPPQVTWCWKSLRMLPQMYFHSDSNSSQVESKD